MAVVFDAIQATMFFDGGGGATTFDHTSALGVVTVSNGANRALIALIALCQTPSPSPTVTSVTWDQGGTNQAMSFIGATNVTSGAPGQLRVELWGLVAPTSGQKTLRVVTSAVNDGIYINELALTGVNQTGGTTSFANVTSNSATSSSTETITVTSAVGNMGVVNWIGDLTVSTPGVGETAIYTDTSGAISSAAGARKPGAAGTITQTNSATNNAWAGVGVNVVALATAGGLAIPVHNFKIDKFKTPFRSMGPNAGLFQVKAYPVISTGQAPFVQTDWPLPGQNPRQDEFFVSDRARFMVQQPASFFNHYDWPLPQANPRPDEFYSFENVQFISRQPASLFNHYDWPNSKTYQPIDQFYAYNQTLPMAQQPASFFNHYDWPNPQPVQWYQSWTFSNVQFISQQPASLGRNYDWPNPPRVTWYQDWSQNLQQTTLKPSQNLPFNQYDWPNPRTYPRPDEFYSFSNITVISNQPASFFNNQDWPNPRQYPRPDEFYSFSNVGIISQQPASLYRNYDWPNPRIAPPIDQFWAQNLVANLSNQPMPFNQFDWPNPRGYPPIDQTWYQNLVSFLSQANPQPFNQFDWPLPKTTVPIDQFWSQSLVQTLPPPPPPEQVIGGGHQWTEADVKRAAAQWLAVMRWYPGVRR